MSEQGAKVKIKNQRMIRVGNSYYLGVPIRYIQDGLVDPESAYDLEINKSEEKNYEDS